MREPRRCAECGAPVTCANRKVTLCSSCLRRRRDEAFASAIRVLSRARREKKGGAE